MDDLRVYLYMSVGASQSNITPDGKSRDRVLKSRCELEELITDP